MKDAEVEGIEKENQVKRREGRREGRRKREEERSKEESRVRKGWG